MWALLAKILLTIGKREIKRFAFKSLGLPKVFRSKTFKGAIKSFGNIPTKLGMSKELQTIKQYKNLLNAYDKKYASKEFIAKKSGIPGELWLAMERMKREETQELLRTISKYEARMQKQYQNEMIKSYQNGEGLGYRNFKAFKRSVMKNTDDNGRKKFQDMFGEQLLLIFKSSWIAFGMYIPYGGRSNLGILALQLKKGSKRNPNGYYEWIRIPRWVWDKLVENSTGENFWKVWYNKNRTNKRYLTAKSIYWLTKKENK